MYSYISILTSAGQPAAGFRRISAFSFGDRRLKRRGTGAVSTEDARRDPALWHAFVWAMSWVSVEIEGKWLLADILISVMNIYFQFQFVTNLAAIAEKYQTEEDDLHGKMLKYRTWQTVILTVITIVTELLPQEPTLVGYLFTTMAVVYLILAFCLIKALFDLRRCVQEPQPEPGETESAASRTHVPKEESTAEAGAETD